MSDDYVHDDSISQIERIDFDILGNTEIKNMSALGEGPGIEIPDLYDSSEPKKGGLIDPRLGTGSHETLCANCGLNTTYCPGHFGHIDLAAPVFHIGFLPYIVNILKCICPRCSKLLIYKNEDDYIDLIKMRTGKERMTYIRNASKNVAYCQNVNFGCGVPIPKIRSDIKKSSSAINIIAEIEHESKEEGEGKKKTKYILTPDVVYEILKNISDDDCKILGMDPTRSRPEDMVHKTFPVPPVPMRPSARGDFAGGTSMEDDLTHKLADIVKANLRIIKNKENENNKNNNNSKFNPDHAHLLQYHVATYIENDSVSLLKSEQKGKPFKSLASRLKGKSGRVRGNLMGKRGDHTSRTVITSDPTIGNNMLGVPIKIAMNLTFPEVVTPNNIDRLNKLVRNGRDQYPGANCVFPVSKMGIGSGKRVFHIDLRYRKEATELHYGDVVERHLVDGDIVLFNRQPTLHKQSMMGHTIKVIDDPELMTFRLSVSATKPYNADFDGDEMNAFICQSIQTQIELKEIAAVELQIISSTRSQAIIGIVQDGLLGAHNLTSPTVTVYWRDAMNIIAYTSIEDFSVVKKNKDITGQELYSLIIPSGITTSYGSIKIKNGQLISGQMNKSALGADKKNTLIQLIWDGYGIEETKKFIDNTQRLVNNFNLFNGFSVGVGDIYINDTVKDNIEKEFQTKELKINHYITQNENNPDIMNEDIYEYTLFSEMNIIRDNVSKMIVSNMDPSNAFNIMATSGSKGDHANIGQMSGCLGLQAFEGKIMPKKYNRRTLAYYHQNDDRASSRGLVRSSFFKGLEFPEFVFHLMAARIGIIDGAIKSVTGDTEIIIQENGQTKNVRIGDWIDEQMALSEKYVKHEDTLEMELLDITDDITIPTCDEKGNVTWGKITAITRHDPTKEMYEIHTYGGRKVIVADSKSLLIWNNELEKYEPKLTPEVKIGDYVPVIWQLSQPPIINNYIDMINYFPKTEYEYLYDTHYIKDNFIYNFPIYCEYGLCDKFMLTRDNGVFIGLFLASGSIDISNGYIQIINSNKSIQNFIKNWFNNLKLSFNIDISGNITGWSSLLATFLTKLLGYDTHHKYIPHEAFSAPDEFIIGILDGYFSGEGNITDNALIISSTSHDLIEGINMLCNRIGIVGKITTTKIANNNINEIILMNILTIKSQWATQFKNKINLTNISKQIKLHDIRYFEEYTHFIEQKDTVLDKIINIKKVDRNKYKKLYDITIPGTLTFSLRSGLICQDTADTGYTQRKLVKSMEDIMIKYDGTVRSANNTLIQLIYGDSGADTTKQYDYIINLLELNNEDLANKFKFTKDELKNMKNFSEKDNDKLYNTVLHLRDTVREKVRKAKMNYIVLVTKFMLPVNLNRIIETILNKDYKGDPLDPSYVVDMIEKLCTNNMTTMLCMSNTEKNNTNSLKIRDETEHKWVLKTAFYDALNPKKLIDMKVNKKQFDEIVRDIAYNFNKNMIEPGEMTGIIAAQSTGEPLTQMSIIGKTKMLIRDVSTNTMYYDFVGTFIDNIIDIHKSDIKELHGHAGSIIYDTNQYEVLSVDIHEKVIWKPISQITRHLTNGDLIKVTTKLGRTVTTTKSHSHLKRTIDAIVPVEAGKLRIGDRIPIARKLCLPSIELTSMNMNTLDFEFGRICGIYLSETGNKNNINIETIKFLENNFNKCIPAFVYGSNQQYIAGIISGYFISDADFKNNIEVTSESKQLMEDILLLCNYFDINGYVSEKESCHTDTINYSLIIHNKYAKSFSYEFRIIENLEKYNNIINLADRTMDYQDTVHEIIPTMEEICKYIGLDISIYHTESDTIDIYVLDKFIKDNENAVYISKDINLKHKYELLKNTLTSNVLWDPIIKIELIDDPFENVYDFTVPGSESFMVNTGIFVHNTLNAFHTAGIASKGSVTQGVPRMKELLSVSKKPKTPQMIIYLTDEFSKNKDMANKIGSHIKHTTLGDIRGRINVYYDPHPNLKNSIMEKDNIKKQFFHHKGNRTSCQSDINGLPWLIRIEIDREKMLEKEVTMLEISSKFCSWWEKRFADSKSMKKEEKKVINKITQLAVLTNSDNDKQPILHIRFNVKDADKEKDKFDISTIDGFIDHIIDRFKLKGINSVNKIDAIQEERNIKFDEDSGEVSKDTHWVVYTGGVNMEEIRYLNGIDLTRTVSNHVMDMYNIFGIEIARSVLLREITSAYENAGSEVNYQHISITVDQMTSSGAINSLDRHGMNKSENDPLSRASFEKTVEQLTIAAVYGESDNMRGVSSRIMAGAVVKGGTGYCDLELDTEMIEKSEYLEDTDYSKKFTELHTGTLASDIIKNNDDDIFMPM